MLPLHVYVHFPWCLEKCPYCDFVSFKTTRDQIPHQAYADAVVRELAARREWFEGHAISTIFLGGGTPSLWDPRAIESVLSAITAAFPVAAEVEVTAECNPSSLDLERARGLVAAGVNRLSVGVQSLDDAFLKFLGRLHDADLARRAIDAALQAAPRASADLIFALPDQPAERAARDATELAELGLRHISAYALTIEPGTRFGELARRGRLPIAEDDATCDAFLAIEAALAGRGLHHYEVSNYAVPGQEARHNLGYWRGAPYLGLGCAAYGCGPLPVSGALRYRNAPDPRAYMDGTLSVAHGVPAEGDGVTSTVEPLDAETLLRERIMLGLRLDEGLDLSRASSELGLSTEASWSSRAKTIDRLVRNGDLSVDGTRLRIPSPRRLGTDGIAARLF